ncbi:hypothetical protein Tco_1154353, partial [Tanacetum coccineum]
PEGDRCPFDLSKPLPLKGCPDHLTVAAEYFFNNDLEYLKSGSEERKYTTSITKTKDVKSQLNKFSPHDVYSTLRILSVASVQVENLHGYGYLKEIVVQHKLFNLEGSDIVDLAVVLRMFTRRIIIQKRVEDVQLGVESYQKKLNLTKPQKDFPTISTKEPYTPSFDPPGVVYEDSSNRKILMRADKLYKFLDETLTLERRVMRNLERLVGAKELEMDYRLMQRKNIRVILHSIHSDDRNPSRANIKQALR